MAPPSPNRTQRNALAHIEKLATITNAPITEIGTSLETSLMHAEILGRAAVSAASACPAKHRILPIGSIFTEEFPVPERLSEVDLTNRQGQIVISRLNDMDPPLTAMRTAIHARQAGAEHTFISLSVPSHAVSRRYIELKRASSGESVNTDLRMTHQGDYYSGTAYPLRSPEDLQRYDMGVRYMAPLISDLLRRKHDLTEVAK